MTEITVDKCPNCAAPLSVDANGKCVYCGAVIHRDAVGPAVTPTTMTPEITELVRAGKKLEAIKEYRRLTGLGLSEAKDAIEAEEVRLKAN